jgi:DNA-binding NarL/FixJ family response regulator
MILPKINVAIVDDHTLFRKAVVDMLSKDENLNIKIQASDIIELFGKLRNSNTNVLLMDLFMPQVNARDTLDVIRDEYPKMKILILSMCTDLAVISDLLGCGIHGYISKNDEPDELVQAIISTYENRIYRNKIFTEALYWHTENNRRTFLHEPTVAFDEREQKIIQLLWDEKSNKDIAEEIFLSIRSVEKIRQNMKEKLGVKSTIGLLKYALQKKIIKTNYKISDVI